MPGQKVSTKNVTNDSSSSIAVKEEHTRSSPFSLTKEKMEKKIRGGTFADRATSAKSEKQDELRGHERMKGQILRKEKGYVARHHLESNKKRRNWEEKIYISWERRRFESCIS